MERLHGPMSGRESLYRDNSDDGLAANYTRSRRPVILVYQERQGTRSSASKREYAIKQMSRHEKLKLIDAVNLTP